MAGDENRDLEVVPSTTDHAATFRATWVPYYLARAAFDEAWTYRIFPWEQIMDSPAYDVFSAVDPDAHVEGLIAFEADRATQRIAMPVAFLATAPWNHGEDKSRRGVGTGLLGFAVEHSRSEGFDGAVILSSTPESETFYEKLHFERTGTRNREGLGVCAAEDDQVKM